MNKLARLVVVVSLAGSLALINWSIYSNERQLSGGTAVYLKLAPVDPRSLMQGDYMALRFEMANEIRDALGDVRGAIRAPRSQMTTDGHVIVETDENHIGRFVAIYSGQPLLQDQLLLQFRMREGRVKFATNAFFFQERDAKKYESADYGMFRVGKHGKLLLTSLHDSKLANLGAETPGSP
ncbi:MAG: GDYXXLXY domain-containing protein [Gammaproteobacteria bacterium]